jgi:dihydropteroate synthase
MGILNVTPDSFSDGGEHLVPASAVRWAEQMLDDGADIIDIGGESTRPGATSVDADIEIRRVLPVVEALAHRCLISIDTMKAEVARAAVAAGAKIINDVSASLAHVAADLGVGWIAMHMQGAPRTMQVNPFYTDVVAEVCEFLDQRVATAQALGVPQIWIDPGIGFGKRYVDNLDLLRRLDAFVDTGVPVVLGASRKSFLGTLLDQPASDQRVVGSATVAVYAEAAGVDIIRVHDVRATRDALMVARALNAPIGTAGVTASR